MNDDLIGASLGHCVVEEFLGQGGMARVYRGRQENLDRVVAIKVLPPYYAADIDFVERFKLEARAMAKLSHPNIVTIHDAGEEHGRLFIVMEYIGGGTLKDRMAAPMMMRDVTRIVHEVAAALSYAHAQGIVHRDVKPVNVLMNASRGGSGRAVLSDFGIAKVLATSAALTHSGAGVGTPEYMSPEQCRGAAVDARSDIYALGVMLFEMLTGRTPFVADNYTALAHSHIYEAPPLPSALNPRLSPAVQSVILKALEKDPADRFQKATELAAALEMAVESQTPVKLSNRPLAQPTAPPRPQPQPQYPIIVCPRCRHQNAATQRFCSACGESLIPGQPAPAANVVYPPPQQGGSWVSCPGCGAPNPPLNRYCNACGVSLLAGVAGFTCRQCGTRNPAGKRFCTQCGAPLR